MLWVLFSVTLLLPWLACEGCSRRDKRRWIFLLSFRLFAFLIVGRCLGGVQAFGFGG